MLEGLSFITPSPAFCAASDMARGDGEAENRADNWRCAGDVEKPADKGETRLPTGMGDGDAAKGDGDAPKAVNPRVAPGERSAMLLDLGEGAPKFKLLRGDGDPKDKLLWGERLGKVMLLRGDLLDVNDARGLGEVRDMFPKEDKDATGSA